MLLGEKTTTTGLTGSKKHEDGKDGDKHIVALDQDNLESLRQIMNREAKRFLHDLQAVQAVHAISSLDGRCYLILTMP